MLYGAAAAARAGGTSGMGLPGFPAGLSERVGDFSHLSSAAAGVKGAGVNGFTQQSMLLNSQLALAASHGLWPGYFPPPPLMDALQNV